jgi:hypothetical protein
MLADSVGIEQPHARKVSAARRAQVARALLPGHLCVPRLARWGVGGASPISKAGGDPADPVGGGGTALRLRDPCVSAGVGMRPPRSHSRFRVGWAKSLQSKCFWQRVGTPLAAGSSRDLGSGRALQHWRATARNPACAGLSSGLRVRHTRCSASRVGTQAAVTRRSSSRVAGLARKAHCGTVASGVLARCSREASP